MGRSSASCFKLISCGCFNQSVDRDEIDLTSENKGHDKRQAPSNAVVNEKISSTESKQIPEPITVSSELQVKTNISEKTSDDIWTEEPPNSLTKNAAVSTMTTKPASEEDDIKCEPAPDESQSQSESKHESAVLVIQTYVRRFLAERRLVKHKNVVKLQAAVRGHLVRNHAVGTLRCVQAIVKMQALVRARREKGVQNANSTPTHISIEKLLSNRLARQLLESTPKAKQINIKCDPSKSDSAWNWLERWMSVSSPETLQPHTPDHVQEKAVNTTESEVKMVISANNFGEATVRYEEKEKLVNTEEKEKLFNIEEKEKLVDIEENSNVKPESIVIPVSETKPIPIPENPESETKPIPIPENPESETETKPIPENPVSETEPVATDQPDSDGMKNVLGSRKASNPAFIAAQSRFEALTSPKTNPLKPPNSCNQNDEPGLGSVDPSAPGQESLMTDVEPLVTHGSRVVQKGDSECGTELSVTSTLDSPDQFETGNKKPEEVKVVNDTVGDMHTNIDNNNNTPEKQVDEKLDDGDIEPELEPEPGVQLSVSESPRSHITTNLESQGTPSSQISTPSKKTKKDKRVSSQTQKSWSYSKKSSPVSSSVDYGLRNSLEHLPKEPKSGKRRNVFGSPKPDSRDHEPSVPGYMQATESARAKAVANSSPRSSPDVHDKESNLKKRHSLPGADNTRQGSPRVQRSMSQAVQTTKGNGSQERKWQR